MIIQATGLTKAYQSKVAVNHIDLAVERGSLTALLGPNGAGKTTTMSMLTGLLAPTAGIIQMTLDTKISMVFQQSILDDQLTVKENLMIRSQFYEQAVPQIDALIEKVGLSDFINQKYGSLSGGQRRRVDIARALINQPDVLFLDEPTTGLDIQTRSAIWDLLHSLQHDTRLTIILTTHYLEEADNADEVYIIDHGKVIASGSAAKIKNDYATNRLTIITNEAQQLMKLIPKRIPHTQDNQKVICLPADTQAALTLLEKYRQYIVTFDYQNGTIDDAFLKLTGREMR